MNVHVRITYWWLIAAQSGARLCFNVSNHACLDIAALDYFSI